MLDDLKIIHQRDVHDSLGVADRRWREVRQAAEWAPQVATKRNLAKQLALELLGKTIVVYAGEQLAVVAGDWKQAINRYAKQLAWKGELNDDEIIGWTKQPVHKLYAVVELRTELETELVSKRWVAVGRLLSGMRPAPLVVDAQGSTLDEQVLYCRALGEFVAIYLALLNGLDPSDRGIVDKLHRELT